MENKADIEQEKGMYAVCFAILAICMILLVFLSGAGQQLGIKASITGAAILEQETPEEKAIVDYNNVSFENITQELALNAIVQAENDMQEMKEYGFKTAWVNDQLIGAKKYFEGENYTALLKQLESIENIAKKEKAKELLIQAQEKIGVPVDYKKVLEITKAINNRKTEAYEINDLIRASELRINDFEKTSLNATLLFEILSEAKVEFKEERFEDAVDLLAKIEPKINEIEAENTFVKTIYRVGKDTTLNFIKEHYKAIIATIIIIIIITLVSYNRVKVSLLKTKIKDMNIENDVLMTLMKKAQTDYYAKGIIPKKTYEAKLLNYKERLLEIKEQLPVLKSRLDKLSKMKRLI